jgi:hypothetical protein
MPTRLERLFVAELCAIEDAEGVKTKEMTSTNTRYSRTFFMV